MTPKLCKDCAHYHEWWPRGPAFGKIGRLCQRPLSLKRDLVDGEYVLIVNDHAATERKPTPKPGIFNRHPRERCGPDAAFFKSKEAPTGPVAMIWAEPPNEEAA